MNIKLLAVAASLNMLVPAIAFGQNMPNSEPAPTVQPASVNTSGQPLICKYYVYNGQILPRRDCRTADQWRHIRQDTQRTISQFQLQALQQQ